MLRKSPRKDDDQSNGAMPFEECLAKTYLSPQGRKLPGRSVFNHCQIVGEVAREILARMPRDVVAGLIPMGAELAAACHDIGKVSPTFQEKILRGTDSYQARNSRPELKGINPELEKKWGGHAGVSQVTAKAMAAPEFVPEILGQHHGFSPPVAGLRAIDESFGGEHWQRQRELLVWALKKWLDCDWPQVNSIPQARLLAGLTSVADWVGSGQFFEDPSAPWQEAITRAIDDAGFIAPSYRTGQSFEHVFGFSARPPQQQLIDVVNGPGVYVLEAPMGMGKTEAALYAAYQMLCRGKASGIYFALPTQLTSNKIFERFNAFLASILSQDCSHRSLLLHGNAWLLDTEMGEEGRPGGAWFNQAKRGLLAPFAVGTVDQALMAAMNVKHGFVRAFGLVGKVVILDEVHTYDAYTGTLLDSLVKLLQGLHCTVIILSATLNQDRREQLLGNRLERHDYPLITAAPKQQSVSELPVPITSSQTVSIRMLADDDLAIRETLDRAMRSEQVLWIENTVVEAQQRYLDLAARATELGLACGLLHSRFTSEDRQRIEDRWVNLFGKHGWPERSTQGRILVGTQVLEQSLDIDADFLVSRFAPTDMLLQRLGRLWRHTETPRAPSAVCEAWFLAPNLEQAIAAPPSALGTSAFVYSPYVLCRSLTVWQGKASVCLPQDIRHLIEQTYSKRDEEGAMSRWLHELDNGTPRRKGRKALEQLARVTLADTGTTMPENKAQTRYSEQDNLEVLLLREIAQNKEQEVTRLLLLNGEQLLLPWSKHILSKRQWRELTAKLMRQVVAVNVKDAPERLSIDTLTKLGFHNCFYLGNPEQDEAVLRVVLVDESGQLQCVQGVRVHEKHELGYRDDMGYRVTKG